MCQCDLHSSTRTYRRLRGPLFEGLVLGKAEKDKVAKTGFSIAMFVCSVSVKSDSQKFEVWVPSVADVTLVLLNMGASFVTLFPLEKFQPPFSEGDLL